MRVLMCSYRWDSRACWSSSLGRLLIYLVRMCSAVYAATDLNIDLPFPERLAGWHPSKESVTAMQGGYSELKVQLTLLR